MSDADLNKYLMRVYIAFFFAFSAAGLVGLFVFHNVVLTGLGLLGLALVVSFFFGLVVENDV